MGTWAMLIRNVPAVPLLQQVRPGCPRFCGRAASIVRKLQRGMPCRLLLPRRSNLACSYLHSWVILPHRLNLTNTCVAKSRSPDLWLMACCVSRTFAAEPVVRLSTLCPQLVVKEHTPTGAACGAQMTVQYVHSVHRVFLARLSLCRAVQERTATNWAWSSVKPVREASTKRASWTKTVAEQPPAKLALPAITAP